MITYGVYLPTYFITKKALFYICAQLYYSKLYIHVFIS